MLKGIIISFLLSLVWIGAQIAAVHLRKPRRVFLLLLSLFTITMPLFPLAYFLTPRDLFFLPQRCSLTPLWLGLSAGLLLHVLIFFAYVEFFYYVERSVTLRMLVELRKRPESPLELIQETYGVEGMVRERMEAMRENGFVRRINGSWLLTRKGSVFAKTFILFRSLLNLGPGQ